MNHPLPTINRQFKRLRHWRGHGVHSPLAYSLVREVFMKRHPAGGELYEALRAEGVARRYAREMGALQARLGLGDFRIIDGRVDFGGRAEILLHPRRHRELYGSMVRQRHAMTIDRRCYVLFIYDPSLPRQHFYI